MVTATPIAFAQEREDALGVELQVIDLWCCSGVRAMSLEDEEDIAAFPHDEEAELTQLGALEYVGEAGYSTIARRSNPYALL